MFFLIGPALFVLGVGVPAVLGRRAKIPTEALAGIGYKAALSNQGFSPGESPFSERFNDSGVVIAAESGSPLGQRVFEFSKACKELEQYRGKTYHFTLSEGRFLDGLVNTASAVYLQMQQATEDVRKFHSQIPPVEQIPEEMRAVVRAQLESQLESLMGRVGSTTEAWEISMLPLVRYFKEKEPRQKQYPW